MASEQRPLREMALFAGAGGGILGGLLLGWETICAVEINAFCARRLMQRQNEGYLPPFPIWDDVSTFDGRPWRGRVDVVSGGFPCQDISAAGNGAGITGERSGLWKQMARIIGEIGPRHALVENSPMLTIRGHGVVLRDLAEMGYDARWGVFSCRDVGGVHLRERIFILASDHRQKRISGIIKKEIPKFRGFPWGQDVRGIEDMRNRSSPHASGLCRGSNGVADYMERISSIGNGQVPSVVKLAFETLEERN